MIEDRLINIETQLAFQEDAIEELSKVVYQQQQALARLETICQTLAGHIQTLTEEGREASTHEIPPHY